MGASQKVDGVWSLHLRLVLKAELPCCSQVFLEHVCVLFEPGRNLRERVSSVSELLQLVSVFVNCESCTRQVKKFYLAGNQVWKLCPLSR